MTEKGVPSEVKTVISEINNRHLFFKQRFANH